MSDTTSKPTGVPYDEVERKQKVHPAMRISDVQEFQRQIAAAMDILEEIPGETLDERLKNLAAMVGPLVAAYRRATT